MVREGGGGCAYDLSYNEACLSIKKRRIVVFCFLLMGTAEFRGLSEERVMINMVYYFFCVKSPFFVFSFRLCDFSFSTFLENFDSL